MRAAAVLLALALVATGCRRREGPGAGPQPGTFSRVGPLVAARLEPRVAPLAEGRWLITTGTFVGGEVGTDTSGCTELYDPASNAFFELPGMVTPRISHALAALPDGDVLVVGGWSKGETLDTLERFRGRDGRFETLPLKLLKPRTQAQAVPLPNDRVAIVGGLGKDGGPIAEVEMVDLVAGKVWVACRLAQPRGPGFAATLLEDGTVLVSGGELRDGTMAALERVDPKRGKVQALAPMAVSRARHAAVRLSDGRVLFVGGETRDPKTGKGGPEARCEIFDPRKDRCFDLPGLPAPRVRPAAVLLTDGRVLIAGGWNVEGALNSSLFYDPRSGAFKPGPALFWSRPDDVAIPLERGRALLLGSGVEIAERLE